MQVRFGYVAIALNLKNSSTSKTITLSNLNKISDNEQKLYRLRRIAKENLENLLRVIRYNTGEKIHVYRITSKLIPFATYPLDFEWDYVLEFAPEFMTAGQLIRESQMRVSAHPDHFTVLNSPDDKVFQGSLQDLVYHHKAFTAMGLDAGYKLVLHLGGFYGDKAAAIKRFKHNFNRLPREIQGRIVLENDDKIYTAAEVFQVCKELNLPMVLDLHHHACNPGGDLIEMLPGIWGSWGQQRPKIHVSSPKNEKSYRHHADFIETTELFNFIKLARQLQTDFDIMVEAKMKDIAMFQLVTDLANCSGGERLDPTSLFFK